MGFVVIGPVNADDPVQASLFNQLVQNVTHVRRGELKVSDGDDTWGVRILPGGNETLSFVGKKNAEPDTVTVDNADVALDFGKTSFADEDDF